MTFTNPVRLRGLVTAVDDFRAFAERVEPSDRAFWSPNFTTAGLINRPPHGNSELTVLTTLAARRNGLRRAVSVLGLDRGFTHVENLRRLKTEPAGQPPDVRSQGIADTTYRVGDATLKISFLAAAPAGARVLVLLQKDGSWMVIGECDAGGVNEVTVPVAGLAEIDGRTKLLELRGTTLRIDLVAADGSLDVFEERREPRRGERRRDTNRPIECGVIRVTGAHTNVRERRRERSMELKWQERVGDRPRD